MGKTHCKQRGAMDTTDIGACACSSHSSLQKNTAQLIAWCPIHVHTKIRLGTSQTQHSPGVGCLCHVDTVDPNLIGDVAQGLQPLLIRLLVGRIRHLQGESRGDMTALDLAAPTGN